MCHGKTYLAEKYGWIDFDNLVSENRRKSNLSQAIEGLLNKENWHNSRDHIISEANATLDILSYRTNTVLMASDYKTLERLGVTAIRGFVLEETSPDYLKALSYRDETSRYYSQLNYFIVQDEARRGKTYETVRDFKRLELAVLRCLDSSGLPVACKWLIRDGPCSGEHDAEYNYDKYSPAELLELVESGVIDRAIIDYLVRCGKFKAHGYGVCDNEWAEVIAPAIVNSTTAPRGFKRVTRKPKAVTVHRMAVAMEKSGGIDPWVHKLVAHHKNSTEEFIQNIVAVVGVIRERAKNPDMLIKLLLVSEESWMSCYGAIRGLLAKSNRMMGLEVADHDRLMIADLIFCGATSKHMVISEMLTPRPNILTNELKSLRAGIPYGMSKVEPLGMKVAISHICTNLHELSFKFKREEGKDLKMLMDHCSKLRGTLDIEMCIPYGTGRQKVFWAWLIHTCCFELDVRSCREKAKTLRSEMQPEGGAVLGPWDEGVRDILAGVTICSNEWACSVAKLIISTNPRASVMAECVRDAINMMYVTTMSAKIHADMLGSETTIQIFNSMPGLNSTVRLATEMCICRMGLSADMVRWAGSNWHVKVQLVGRWADMKGSEVNKAITAASVDWILPDSVTSIDRMGATVRNMSPYGDSTLLAQLAVEEWSWSDYTEEAMIGLERYVHGRLSKGGLGITTPDFKQYTITGDSKTEDCLQGTLGSDEEANKLYAVEGRNQQIPTARGFESFKKVKTHKVKWEPGMQGLSVMVRNIVGVDKTKSTGWGDRFKLRIGLVGFVDNIYVPLLEWYGRKLMAEGKGLEQAQEEVACAALDLMSLR
jgi:hypothetical protein